MAMICAICSLSGTVADVMLLPHTVVYRGYSLCEEHLHFWESNREAEWDEIVELARPAKPKWVEQIEELPPLEEDEEIIVKGEEVTVVNAGHKITSVAIDGEIIPIEAIEKIEVVTSSPDDVTMFDLGELGSGYNDVSDEDAKKIEEGLEEFKNKRRRRKKTYYCTKCKKKHSRKSNIGKKHERWAE